MIFTVLIALEFKKSLLVVAQRQDTVVQMRSIIIIAIPRDMQEAHYP